MAADLVPREDIPKLAEKIDSPAMLTVLRHLEQTGFLFNNDGIDQETAAILHRLAALGLVDTGFDGPIGGKPFIWVRSTNGSRILEFFEGTLKLKLKIHPRAHPALELLPEKDRRTVLGTVDYLRRSDPVRWPRELAVPLNVDKPMYLLRVTPELRAFITVLDDEDIELSDIVREETLRLFGERERDAAAQ